jgi:hypothetical protein
VINRYPKVRLTVREKEGLVDGAEVAVGNDAPPPPEKIATNYFDTVDPLRVVLQVDEDAPSGAQSIDGEVLFYYCVKKSGFCTRKKAPVEINFEIP